MGNEAEKIEPTAEKQTAGGASKTTSGLDIAFIIGRAKEIMTNPSLAWSNISSEQRSMKELYMAYVIPMAAAMVVGRFVGGLLWGYSVGPFQMNPSFGFLLSDAVYNFVVHLVMLGVGAMILSWLAPKFDGTANNDQTFSLMAYATTPVYLAGLLAVLPIPGVLLALVSLYGIYLFWNGLTTMTGVPTTSRVGYTLASFVSMIVAGLILALVTSPINPMKSVGASVNDAPDIKIGDFELKGKEVEKLGRDAETASRQMRDLIQNMQRNAGN
jgi:hypothetical protein